MKVCIAGAGSTRLPLMMASMSGAGSRIDLVTLFDIRPERIRALMPVGLALCRHLGNPPPFRIASSLDDAVDGCDALIMTIRPGFEERRAADERACMDLGVIGQETTGPAGFAFATRTIPAVARICGAARRLSPGFLPVIFTNPAGLVTRAMLDLGFDRAVGICDSATVAAARIARAAGIDPDEVDFEVSGLNHLSWTRRVTGPSGADLLAAALADPGFVRGLLPWHDGAVDPADGIPVEYLYYFMHARTALAAMLHEPLSRGEALVKANSALLNDLAGAGVAAATAAYASWLAERNGTYMSYAMGERDGSTPGPGATALDYLAGQVGGYAEVAMELLSSAAAEHGRVMALNVRNNGSIPELPDRAVVESDCIVDRRGVTVRRHAPMPPAQAELVRRVSDYEDLAVKAVFQAMRGRPDHARRTAVAALTAHPLVPGGAMAEKLMSALFGDVGLDIQKSSDMCLTIPETSP